MINVGEYKQYFNDNYKLINTLKNHNSITYDRLAEVMKVLNIIMEIHKDSNKVDEEFEIIFEVGFSYFHEQLEQIKIYYHNYFKSDYHYFQKYEFFINYTLYLDDLIQTLTEKKQIEETDILTINKIQSEIDVILLKKLEPSLEILDEYNKELDILLVSKEDFLTTLEIYSMIYEELEL